MTAESLDIAIIVLILLSTIVGLVMGFTKEFLTLGALLLAGTLTVSYTPDLASKFPPDMNNWLKWGLAGGGIFIISLIIGLIISNLLSKGIERLGLGIFDHVLGTIFGLALGVVVVTSIVLIIPSILDDPKFKESHLLPYFQDSAEWVKSVTPDDLPERVDQFAQKLAS